MKENKKSVILFAGTTEGRQLAEYLQELDRPFVICVATGYGRDLLEDICRPGPDRMHGDTPGAPGCHGNGADV